MHRTPRIITTAALAFALVGLAAPSQVTARPAATHSATTAGTRYVDRTFTVDQTRDVVYATAPSLTTSAAEPLTLDAFVPVGDDLNLRPAIVFIHGGGFKTGTKEAIESIALAYAERGYVTFSINYRLDPGNQCQAVQDGAVDGNDTMVAEATRCRRAVEAAQHDSQAAIRWVRANAATYGVDSTKIAAWGSSAGAVTTTYVAYESDDPGSIGDHLEQSSSIQAGVALSGCSRKWSDIGQGDAPMLFVHTDGDPAVPFDCAEGTADAAKAAGIPTITMFWYGEATHARRLYRKYQSDIDATATAFLIEHLGLGTTRTTHLTIGPFDMPV